MKVILISGIKDLGERGQIVEVKDGYANNYLIPQNLALRATRGKTKEVEQLARAKMVKADRELAKARDVSERIQEHDFDIRVKVGVGRQALRYHHPARRSRSTSRTNWASRSTARRSTWMSTSSTWGSTRPG